MIARAWAVCAAVVLTAACGPPRLSLPTGPTTPAADGREAFERATAACRAARTFTAEVGLTGRINGRRARGRLLAGVAAPASAYLDAPAPFGASVFVFAAVGDEATLLLPRDRLVLEHGHPADVLEAVSGVALAPKDLRDTLTGCAPAIDADGAQQIGESWRLVPGPPTVYLRRDRPADPWRIVAVVHSGDERGGWRADYSEYAGYSPRRIRLTSVGAERFDLQLTLSQVEVNVPLEDDVFRPKVPNGYTPVTLEQLRASAPFSESKK